MDVIGHKVLWVSPLAGGSPYSVFQFSDPRMRIDFPRWAPALGGVLFDRVAPEGGDIWAMEGFE
jgi:hypothetical protein